MTLTLIQDQRLENLHAGYLTNVIIDFEGTCMSLSLVGLVSLKLILSRPISVQGSEPYSCDFVNNNNNKCWHADIYWLISFKFSMMIGNTKLYILVTVWMALNFIQGHSFMRNQKLLLPISYKFHDWFSWIVRHGNWPRIRGFQLGKKKCPPQKIKQSAQIRI